MASIGSLSTSTSSQLSGASTLRGYGGLASGLDRDTLIESMTYATRARIAAQQQKKDKLQWQQDAYRSVTDKLVALSSKYMDYTNPTTNLSSSDLFARTNITSNGVNSSKVSVTSTGDNAADSLTILGVKQMAKNATATTDVVSDRTLSTGVVGDSKVSNFYDESLTFKYGDKTYTVQFGEVDTTNSKTAADQMNAALKKVVIDEEAGTTLADVVSFGATTQTSDITLKKKAGNSEELQISGGSEAALRALLGNKISDDESPSDYLAEHEGDLKITTTGLKISAGEGGLYREEAFIDRIAGQTLTFDYNGQRTTIEMLSKEDIEKELKEHPTMTVMDVVKATLQVGFDNAFGAGRIQVDFDEQTNNGQNDVTGQFSFKTMLAGTNQEDNSSILTLNFGSAGMVGGNGAFNVLAGENNRLNMAVSIDKSGLAGQLSDDELDTLSEKGSYVKINGTLIEFDADASITDIIDKINNSAAGVKVTYLQNSDKFTIASTVDGAAGKIEFGTADAGETDAVDIASVLFGGKDGTQPTVTAGQDAILTVQYSGSSEQVNLVRSSNTFVQDGLNITLKGTFGVYKTNGLNEYDAEIDTEANAGQEVTFEAKANVDSILSTIKDMVEAYNEVVDLVNSLVSTRPDRDYAPLTDEQRAEMTEDQIEKWEAKAKEGILFGDDLLRGLSSDLRFVASGSFIAELEAIGISEASSYTSNGKLTIDENKLRNALESEPDKVARLFTDKENGLMTNMKNVTDSYAKTWGTKGSLIDRAGSEAAAMSLTDNELYKSMKDIDEIIAQLQERLKSEQDRYISQFTALETAIAQMNSQSSYLSSLTGGY